MRPFSKIPYLLHADIWVPMHEMLTHPLFDYVHLPRFVERLDRECEEECSFEESRRRPDLLVMHLVEAALEARAPLAALATRRLHRLPAAQREAAPPVPNPCPSGPRLGARNAWTALHDDDPRRRSWVAGVFDRCYLRDEDVRDLLIAELAVRGAWDLADRLAVERAARLTLIEWAGPLLRVSAAFSVRCNLSPRWGAGGADNECLSVRLASRANHAALDQDWSGLFAYPPAEEYARLPEYVSFHGTPQMRSQ
jgi:hypothetical protein